MFFENKLKLKTVKYEQNEYGEYENSTEDTRLNRKYNKYRSIIE